MDSTVALYRAGQVGELDRRAIEDHGIPGFQLMQRASAAAYGVLRRRWPGARRIAVCAGPGNNGGDAVELARLARADGLEVACHLYADPQRLRGEAREAWQAYTDAGGEFCAPDAAIEGEVIVDGLLGTGLSRPVRAPLDAAIAAINRAREAGAGVLAIDIPSGLSADTGSVLGDAVRADVTVSFIGRKLGLYLAEGPDYAGERRFENLDLPAAVYDDLAPAAERMGVVLPVRLLPPRPGNSHKGHFGHVLCVGGNVGYAGAIQLCAGAAARVGAGLVSIATHPDNRLIVAGGQPEWMVRGLDGDSDWAPLVERATVLAVGPGLGRDDWGRHCLRLALAAGTPLVLDADALNLLPAGQALPPDSIITPHPGEAARLLETTTREVQEDRMAALEALVDRTGAVVVLKGAGSLIGAPQALVRLCAAGNPGMAVGGMGDLLTGTIAALRAQDLSAFDAASLGVLLHARAGDRAAGDRPRGLLPSDLLPYLREQANP